MRILVTGGAGFIGSHVCDRLKHSGRDHFVAVIDNLSLGRRENIAHLIGQPEFKFYKEDLLNFRAVADIFERYKFEAVFHMAANSDIAKGKEEPDADFNGTLTTTYNVLKLMKEHNVKQIIFASSSAVYGERDKLLTEDSGPLLPISHYGAAKMACEAFVSSFVENYNMQAWILRFPNVVGERSTHGVIHDFIKKLQRNPNQLEVLGNGEQFKPYLYVRDLVEAVIFVWERTQDKINVFNIGVESRTKVKDIARMMVQEFSPQATISYTGGDRGWIGDVPEFNYNLSKIHRLGWRARKTSDEAVLFAIRRIISQWPEDSRPE
jgi:UDP-glucose 4-epimerase